MACRGSVILFILFTAFGASGQYFSTGQDPAATKWFHLTNTRYQIIYPLESARQAVYLASILDLTIPAETTTLEARVPRMPFILHTRSTRSNGITTWAPRRIELYTCAPPESYAEEWLEQLALHEYRHAVQISKMNQGFTHALYFIFGEQAVGGMLGLFLPTWFLEGDATCAETALSLTGRGRSPSFQAPLKAQLIEKGTYSFDKATLGSYKTFIPDDYELGYHLVGYGRVVYGPQLWNTAVDRSAKLPFMVVPFASGIRKVTGLTKVKFYQSAMAHFDSIWRTDAARTTCTGFRPVTRINPKNYTDYHHPVHLHDSLFLAAKLSNEEPDRLVSVTRTGQEKRMVRLGNYQSESNSAAGKWIAWAETQPHIRWQNKDFSVIRIHDTERNRTRTLIPRTRYFSPMLKPDGTRIAAVHVDEQNNSRLDILSVPGGKLLNSFPAPAGGIIMAPSWSADGRQITLSLLTPDGKSIEVLDLSSGQFRNELPATFRNISGPSFFYRNYLIFTADYSGIDNLFAIDTLDGTLMQVTSSRYGSGDPDFSSDKQHMIYSETTADGLMIAETEVDPRNWSYCEDIRQMSGSMAAELASLETVNVQQEALDQNLASMLHPNERGDSLRQPGPPGKPYLRGLNLFNPHSWAPVSLDATNLAVNPGVSVLSQNILSSAFASAGYTYDMNERTGKGWLGFRYEGWFPVFDFQASYGKRAGTARVQETGEKYRFTWNEASFDLNILLPLNLSSGAWYRSLQPQTGISLIDVLHDKSTPDAFTKGWIPTLNYRLWFSNYIRSNYQDAYPQWGQTADLNFRHGLSGTNDPGWIGAATLNFYFPGLFRHHGIRLIGAFQERNDNPVFGYNWSGLISYPRGVTDAYNKTLLTLSANYKFPFLRPDLSIGSALYFKRFMLNLFYDWAQGWNDPGTDIYESVGAELTTEVHIMRFIFPFELGVRSAWLPIENGWSWAFLYSVDF
jgi:hypothetical protein